MDENSNGLHSSSGRSQVIKSPTFILKFKQSQSRGASVAQLVEHPTSAQVMILRFVSSSPASGLVLTARSLEPASDSVSPSLCVPPSLELGLSLPLSKIK